MFSIFEMVAGSIGAIVFVLTAQTFLPERYGKNKWLRYLAVAFALISGIGTLAWLGDFWPFVKPVTEHSPSAINRYANLSELNLLSRYKVGEKFRDCPTCTEMVVIPSGTSLIGKIPGQRAETDCGCVNGVKLGMGALFPVHLSLGYRLAVATHEVTVAEWNECVREQACPKIDGRGDDYPAEVSWPLAHKFTDWLSSKSERTYRLLSESEWEFAARGGTVTAYWWGNAFEGSRAGKVTQNRKGRDLVGADEHDPDRVADEAAVQVPYPVARYEANPFGLFDMIGNGLEWVEDCGITFVASNTSSSLAADQAEQTSFPRNGAPYQNVMRCPSDTSRIDVLHTVRKGNAISVDSETASFEWPGKKPKKVEADYTSNTIGTPNPAFVRALAPSSYPLGFRVATTLEN
jgi:formylglycine-generating enzyme required for sulfatase activity